MTIMSFGAAAEVGPIATEEPVLDRAIAILLLFSRLSPSRDNLLHRHAIEDQVRPDGLSGIRGKFRMSGEVSLSTFPGDVAICLQSGTANYQPGECEEVDDGLHEASLFANWGQESEYNLCP